MAWTSSIHIIIFIKSHIPTYFGKIHNIICFPKRKYEVIINIDKIDNKVISLFIILSIFSFLLQSYSFTNLGYITDKAITIKEPIHEIKEEDSEK